jgi:DNA gyrase subunit A
MNLGAGATLLAIARNAEENADEVVGEDDGAEDSQG